VIKLNHHELSSGWAYKRKTTNNDKAKPAERQGRKATILVTLEELAFSNMWETSVLVELLGGARDEQNRKCDTAVRVSG